MTKTLFFLTAFLAAQEANAFAPSAGSNNKAIGGLRMVDDAQVLSDYMAKSHEEKLRAIKEVEDKKNAQIAELKATIEQLKSSTPALPAAAVVEPVSIIPASDAEAKLASYQNFMSEYIVNAQNQKLMAVKEAELKAEQKFQERLEKLLAASGAALPSSDAAVETQPEPVAELSLFEKRNLQVVAAGENSRWGSLEVQKAAESVKSQPVVVASSVVEESSLFDKRNARVAAEGAAGKSRWGDLEVQKASGSSPAPATPAPAKAVTLEDRLNLGARLVGV
mmetsp:Transcript_16550/g.24693  ORF Transcript_16550/g.24693 Transcript_16550/m.24693 type:complete len:279 (+) Transcript_16550:88-924(+)